MANTVKRVPKTVGEARAAALAHPLVGAILAADDRPYKDVEIPEWGGIEVRVRGASGAVVDAHDASMFGIRASMNGANGGGELSVNMATNYRSRFLVGCLFDPETDEPLPITAEQLGQKSARVVNRLFGIAQRLSGAGEQAVEDAGKGSESGQSESSTTD